MKRMLLIFCALLGAMLFSQAAFAEEVEYIPDMQGTEIENWSLSEGIVLSGGVLTNSWTDSTTMNVTAIGEMYSFRDNYEFSAVLYNDGNNDANSVMMVFNYQNDRNFYYLNFGGGGSVSLSKRVSGNDTVVKTYDGTYTMKNYSAARITITVSGNMMTATAESGDGTVTTLFENEELTNANGGRIGFKTNVSVMGVSEIRVSGTADKCILGVKSTSIENGATGVELDPQIVIEFDLQLDPDTVNNSNISINSPDGALAPEQYSISFDGSFIVTIDFAEELRENTAYEVVLGSGLLSLQYGSGMGRDYVLSFTTKPPAFEVASSRLLVRGTDITDLSAYGGERAVIIADMMNNEMADPQPFAALFCIFEGDGRLMACVPFSGEAGLGQSARCSGGVNIPEGLTAEAYYKWIVWDSFDGMGPLDLTEPQYFEGQDFASVDIGLDTGVVTVSGVLPNGLKNRQLSLLVLNPEYEIANAAEDGAAVQTAAQIATGDNGAFSYTFTISEAAGAVSGTYSLYMGGDDIDVPIETEFYYALPNDRVSAIEDINAGADSAAVMAEKLEKYCEVLLYDTEAFKQIDKTGLAERVISKVQESAFSTENAAEIQNYISGMALLEAYEQSKKTAVADSENNILYTALLGLDGWDEAKGTSVVGFYGSKLNAEGKEKVLDALLGEHYDDSDAFGKAFTQFVVIYGIGNCSVDGYGHVEELLRTNAEMAGIDLDEYVPSAADKELITKQIDSIEELQELIDELSDPSTTVPPSNNGGGGGGGGGGTGSTSTGGTRPPLVISSQPEIEEPVQEAIDKSETDKLTFKDLGGFEWAEESVLSLAERGIISKPDDKLFRPADNITRQEFTKLIVAAAGAETDDSTECEFDDVASWAVPYVNAAKAAGYINGIDENTFGGYDNITRQDAVVIIMRAFEFAQDGVQAAEFADEDEIADYAKDAVKLAAGLGIIEGYDGSFEPNGNCTRAQAAKIIYGALEAAGR